MKNVEFHPLQADVGAGDPARMPDCMKVGHILMTSTGEAGCSLLSLVLSGSLNPNTWVVFCRALMVAADGHPAWWNCGENSTSVCGSPLMRSALQL